MSGHGSLRVLYAIAASAVMLVSSMFGQSSGNESNFGSIRRDAAGQAHIFATTDAAAFYALGRVHMRDFPITTLLNIVGSAGDLSKWIGTGGGPFPGLYGGGDLRSREWRLSELAARDEALLPASIRDLLAAYVAGINDERIVQQSQSGAIALKTAPVPLSQAQVDRLLSRPITIRDVLANGLASNGYASMNAVESLAEDDSRREDPIKTHSNGWIVGAQKTVNQKSILLSDPHTSFEKHGQFRAFFLQIKGAGYEASGINVPGMPAIGIGFTPGVSWAQTSNNPDILDVWRAPAAPGAAYYLVDGAPEPIIREQILLEVWDPATDVVAAHAIELAWAGSYEYPILKEGKDRSNVDSIWFGRASFTSGPNYWEFLIRLGYARTVAEARSLFDMNAVAFGNYLLADTLGNVGYIWSGRVPVRGQPSPNSDWSGVQDGSSMAYRWQGFHAAADLPQEMIAAGSAAAANVADAVFINNNVRADRTRAIPTIDLANFPDYMVHALETPDNDRQLRASRLLRDAPGPFSLGDVEAIAFDRHDTWAERVIPLIVAGIDEFGLVAIPECAALRQMLVSWDLVVDCDSLEAIAIDLIRSCYDLYLTILAEYELTHVPRNFDLPGSAPAMSQWTPTDLVWGWNFVAMAVAAYEVSFILPILANRHFSQLLYVGPDAFTPFPFGGLPSEYASWGSCHFLNLGGYTDPIGWGTYPMPGSKSTLFTVSALESGLSIQRVIRDTFFGVPSAILSLPVTDGSHAILEVEMSDPPRARQLAAIGPTELTGDARRYVFADEFRHGIFRDFPTDEAVLAAAGSQPEVVEYVIQ